VNRRFALLVALVALFAPAASASAAGAKKAAPQPVPEATVKIKLGKLDDGRAQI
jgi:hypothetical protein